jgi:hypothetical protein
MLLHLVCLVTITAFVSTGQENARTPSTNPELIEGPWETTGASGIDGIFFDRRDWFQLANNQHSRLPPR